MADVLETVPGTADVLIDQRPPLAQIAIKVDREAAARHARAVQDDAIKDAVKITVIAAGFREVKRSAQQRPAFLPKTWKAGREVPLAASAAAGMGPGESPNVVHQVQQNVHEVGHDVPTDDLDVPTFLRRQAQKA